MITPSALVKYLDQHVIGQDDAKKILSVAIYVHYRKLARVSQSGAAMGKSNVLLVGPTGSGKTLMCSTMARALKVPFVTADATSLTQTQYVNDEIDAILQRLIDKADGDITKAQHGIVFIDEVDKLRAEGYRPESGSPSRTSAGERVQHAMLKIMEGSTVKLSSGRHIDTSNIMFICGGAFVGLDEIISENHAFGFISTSDNENQKILDRLNARVKPTDLFKFGLIQEFTGRLPIVARLQDLSRDMMVRIISEPKDSIYQQFRDILKSENVELTIEPLVFEQIADLAIEYKIGARSLRGIFEEMMTPVLFVLPDRPDIRTVSLTSLFEEPVYAGG